ncbi:immunity 53 family protein [Hymenobacter sp. B81]|uniref:immunity 53 family protein n=1 Tax=Hymenobacter sp. B81 TaxID=3344878 RepID=UPI0037DC90C3
MDLLQRIQRWYTINCNGDWEHSYKVSITNVDNPGWWVEIDLQETCLEKAVLEMAPVQQRTSTDWVLWYIKDQQFIGSGGPGNLSEILSFFLDTLLPQQADPECCYEVFLPVQGHERRLWLQAEARVISESVLEIVQIADSTVPNSYNVLASEDYSLVSQPVSGNLANLTTSFAIGDRIEPYVEQAPDNMLICFLAAPPKSVRAADVG